MKILKGIKMKMKIRNSLIVLLVLAVTLPAISQEYKIPASGKNLKVFFNEINKLEIQGTTGTDIIITSSDRSRDKDERASGLKAINASGLEDNTGIGLSAVEKDGVIEVTAISRNAEAHYLVKVPKNVMVKYDHNSPYGSDLSVKNVESELEIRSVYNDILLDNVTGPITVNTVHGDIDAVFTTLNQSSPSSLVSTHGHVDVTLPATAKANLTLATTWGEIFTDMDINIDAKSSDMRKISSQTVKGTINGGGVSLYMSSTHDNIYLRKK